MGKIQRNGKTCKASRKGRVWEKIQRKGRVWEKIQRKGRVGERLKKGKGVGKIQIKGRGVGRIQRKESVRELCKGEKKGGRDLKMGNRAEERGCCTRKGYKKGI